MASAPSSSAGVAIRKRNKEKEGKVAMGAASEKDRRSTTFLSWFKRDGKEADPKVAEQGDRESSSEDDASPSRQKPSTSSVVPGDKKPPIAVAADKHKHPAPVADKKHSAPPAADKKTSTPVHANQSPSDSKSKISAQSPSRNQNATKTPQTTSVVAESGATLKSASPPKAPVLQRKGVGQQQSKTSESPDRKGASAVPASADKSTPQGSDTVSAARSTSFFKLSKSQTSAQKTASGGEIAATSPKISGSLGKQSPSTTTASDEGKKSGKPVVTANSSAKAKTTSTVGVSDKSSEVPPTIVVTPDSPNFLVADSASAANEADHSTLDKVASPTQLQSQAEEEGNGAEKAVSLEYAANDTANSSVGVVESEVDGSFLLLQAAATQVHDGNLEDSKPVTMAVENESSTVDNTSAIDLEKGKSTETAGGKEGKMVKTKNPADEINSLDRLITDLLAERRKIICQILNVAEKNYEHITQQDGASMTDNHHKEAKSTTVRDSMLVALEQGRKLTALVCKSLNTGTVLSPQVTPASAKDHLSSSDTPISSSNPHRLVVTLDKTEVESILSDIREQMKVILNSIETVKNHQNPPLKEKNKEKHSSDTLTSQDYGHETAIENADVIHPEGEEPESSSRRHSLPNALDIPSALPILNQCNGSASKSISNLLSLTADD